MGKIAGIDVSTKSVAIAVLGAAAEDAHLWTEVAAKGQRASDRLAELVRGVNAALGEAWIKDVETFCIEEIGFVRNGRSTIDLAYVVGAMIALLELRGKIVLRFHPMTIKAKFGMARQDKKAVQRFIEGVVEQTLPTDNVADAFLVALYGRSLSG
jgi:Holliday junction resolvasome RuvABC endonuclease subunit